MASSVGAADSPTGGEARNSGGVRSKIALACDTCRRRKSRCDGKRPTCTHCSNAKLDCIYRPTPTITDSATDPGLANRLNAVEFRLAQLEQQKGTSLAAPVTRHPSVGSGDEDGAFKRVPMPPFHTSAAHKIYQYWPRLRINLSLDGFDPLQFQRQCDEADRSLELNISEAAASTVRLHLAIEYIQRLYHQTNLVPQTIIFLLQMTPTYSLQNAMSQLPARRPNDHMGYMKLEDFSLTLLLLLSVAFHYLSPDPTSDYGTTASSMKCFQLALSRLWTVHSQAEEYMLNTKLMVAVQMQIMYGRPYHAIGLLRQVGLSLSSTWTRSRLSLGPASFITKMHFLMESDLLSEIDGQPTADPSQLFFDTSGNVNGSQTQFPLYSAAPEQQAPLFLDQTLWLRLCLNRILTTIYMINNSYSNPRFVGRPISDFTSELEFWYRSLPIELQFPRTLAAYGLLTNTIPSYKVNLAIRYYFCHLMLNRPVCYFLLHKEIERCVTPPTTPSDPHHLQDLSDLETWVFESSRNCLDNALLIVACLRSHPQLIGWYQAQYLICCYAVVLQMQVQQPNAFHDLEDAGFTLNSIENLLEQCKVQTTGSRWTIDMLRNVRANLIAANPGAAAQQGTGKGSGLGGGGMTPASGLSSGMTPGSGLGGGGMTPGGSGLSVSVGTPGTLGMEAKVV